MARWCGIASRVAPISSVAIRFATWTPVSQHVAHWRAMPFDLAVGARRLHDIGKSGWWQLLWLVPILGWVAILLMLTTDSGIGQNEYGTSEKYPDENDSDDDFFLGEEE